MRYAKQCAGGRSRQAIVELTEQGESYLPADISAREAWLDSRLAELDNGDVEVLARAAGIIDRMAEQ